MELCDARTTDFFIGKEHICGFPAYLAGAKQRCKDHRCRRREPWGECGFQWSDDEKRDDFTDSQWLAHKVELGERMGRKTRGDG
jgi:hypothetical protein